MLEGVDKRFVAFVGSTLRAKNVTEVVVDPEKDGDYFFTHYELTFMSIVLTERP